MINPLAKAGAARKSGGYTLLFAVLTAALVLAVAVFILDVSRKQYELSVQARDSIYSFYAADGGIECVALNPQIFDYSSSHNFSCAGNSVRVDYFSPFTYQYSSFPPESDPNAVATQFSLSFANPSSGQPTCADISVVIYHDAAGYYHDLVDSRGYNECANVQGSNDFSGQSVTWAYGPDASNQYTVERAIQLSHSSAP